MKILLSNYSLHQYGGSETWVRTMFNELSQNHTVHIYTPGKNTVFPEIKPYQSDTLYDLGILNHAECLTYLRDRPNIKKKIYTSHGIIPGAERPVQGADVYVAVSEEVQARLARDGFDSTVIRNPIDVARFTPKKPAKKWLKNVAYVSNNPRTKLSVIKQATKGLKLETVGRDFQLRDVVPTIERADLVVGLGRSCYEAMAMGRNVVVFDYKGADGFVTPETVLEYRKSNCSGRSGKLNWDSTQLEEAFRLYDPTLGPALRDYIIENNNVKKIAEQYLCL